MPEAQMMRIFYESHNYYIAVKLYYCIQVNYIVLLCILCMAV